MKKGSKLPRHFYKVNIGTAMEAAANLFNNSFTRPNTIKLLVAFTSGMIPSGGDRVKLKNAMKSLKDQKIKSIAFSAMKTVFLKELTFNTYANMFVLSGYRLKAIAYRLSRYVSSKGLYVNLKSSTISYLQQKLGHLEVRFTIIEISSKFE